ncbi:MAG: S26 family signal peptidase, partial [Planctomycetota bacterium]
MTNGPASYRDRIPGHVADDAVVRLRLTGSLSKFPVQDHPEVLAAKGDAGFVVLEGPAGSVRRAAAAFRRQDATPVTTPLADPDRNTFPYSFQSMIVAFVIAMAARSFVAEGFVIPTGSMAPTLRGQHILMRGPQTGGEFAVGLQVGAPAPISAAILNNAADRLLGPRFPGTAKSEGWSAKPRQGDRILTHKTLYHFRDPRRWEVVVFRNPANPFGRAPTYIKRLCGLPNERLWIVDGDLFTAPTTSNESLDWDAFQIQRKPDWVQRALWVPVYEQRHDQGGMSTPDGFGAFVPNDDEWSLD